MQQIRIKDEQALVCASRNFATCNASVFSRNTMSDNAAIEG